MTNGCRGIVSFSVSLNFVVERNRNVQRKGSELFGYGHDTAYIVLYEHEFSLVAVPAACSDVVVPQRFAIVVHSLANGTAGFGGGRERRGHHKSADGNVVAVALYANCRCHDSFFADVDRGVVVVCLY